MTYVIVSLGSQSNGVHVIDGTGAIATFPTRKAARAYADMIAPECPGKNLPLVVREATS